MDSKGKNKLRRTANGLSAVIFLITSTAAIWAFLLQNKQQDISEYFKDPIPLKGDENFISKLESACEKYLKESDKWCGLSGPSFGYNVHFYCFMNLDGTVVNAVNPKIDLIHKNKQDTTLFEVSSICDEREDAIEKRRFNEISVYYIDSTLGTEVKTRLGGIQAHCYQHHMEILNGKYPCTSTYATKEINILKS
jgi:peptide deformylase